MSSSSCLHELVAENAAELFSGHGLQGAGVQQRGGLVLHVRPHVVPCFGHLIFIQIDLVGDLFCAHILLGSFLFLRNWGKEKTPLSQPICWDRERSNSTSAVPPGLTQFAPTHRIRFDICSRLINGARLRLAYCKSSARPQKAIPICCSSRAPTTGGSLKSAGQIATYPSSSVFSLIPYPACIVKHFFAIHMIRAARCPWRRRFLGRP